MSNNIDLRFHFHDFITLFITYRSRASTFVNSTYFWYGLVIFCLIFTLNAFVDYPQFLCSEIT